jgi:hypothetical protein
MKKQAQPRTIPLPWVAAGLVGFVIFLAVLVVAAFSLLREEPQTERLPTAVPTARSLQDSSASAVTPPEALRVDLKAPLDGAVVDLGQPVQLVIDAEAPSGLRLVSVTSNGQGIGTFQGLLDTTLAVEQEWVPAYPGTHAIVATVSSRSGGFATAETIRIRVIDRAMLAEHAPIWANVQANVTSIRGLAPLESIEPILLSRTELRQRLHDELVYSEADANTYARVLSAFDFVPRNFDLYQLYQRYLGDSIAGFYDPVTKEFVVISDDAKIDALEQWIYAHEFMHALQDQHFQLNLIADTSLGFEEDLAVRSLAEGEAELLQNLYVEQGYFGDAELAEIFNLISRTRTRDVGYLPPVLVDSGLFPYTVGYDFARTVYEQRGWAGLNQAWQNPPASSEHILHPQRYFAGDAPRAVDLPALNDALGSDWTLIEEAPFGEFLLRAYLEQRLDDDVVDIAATGWGGDRYAVYHDVAAERLVMVLRSVWDSAADQEQFVQAYLAYADATFGAQRRGGPSAGTCWQTTDVVCFYASDDQTLIVRAPEWDLIDRLVTELAP